MLGFLLLSWHADAAPTRPVSFFTTLQREVVGESGAYLGYADSLSSTGSFRLGPADMAVAVQAEYSWTYTGAEGPPEQGSEARAVLVDPQTRLYLDRCDLDDYDHLPPGSLATWLWVPADLKVGDAVPILDQIGTVVELEALALDGQEHEAVRIWMEGVEARTDDYGVMTITWEQSWWYERGSGMFLRSELTERASGTVEGEAGGFVRREKAERRSAPPPVQASTPERIQVSVEPSGCPGLIGLNLLVPLALIGSYYGKRAWGRRRRTAVALSGTGRVELRDVRDAAELAELTLGGIAAAADHPFSPILPDLARRVFAVGGRVQLALHGSRVLGLGVSEPVELTGQTRPGLSMGTAWTEHDELRQAFVYNLGLVSWFAPSPLTRRLPDPVRTIETFSVLQLAAPTGRRWDSELIRRMRPADQGTVAELLTPWLGAVAAPWLEAQLLDGDMGWVARSGGRIVGCGLAGMHQEIGRMQCLYVHPDFRGKGIGAELVAARVDALALLGAERILMEVSTHNPASRHLATKAGFVAVGSLVIESRS